MKEPVDRIGAAAAAVNHVKPKVLRIDSPIVSGTPTVSSPALTVVPAQAVPEETAPEREGTSGQPERRAYPQGSTDNHLLMEPMRKLKPGPFKLLAALRVRCAGKGYCWPSTDTLAADLGVPQRTVERWRDELVQAGEITVTRRGPHSLLYTLTPVERPGPKLVDPKRAAKSGESFPQRAASSDESRAAKSGDQKTPRENYKSPKRESAREGRPDKGRRPRAAARGSGGPCSDLNPEQAEQLAKAKRHRIELQNGKPDTRLSPDVVDSLDLMGEVEAKVKAQRIERGDPPDPPES